MKNLNKNPKKAFSLVEISIVILIIGLLIAGISKASDMIFDANLKSGRALTKGAKVNRMPSLALWLETTLGESLLDKERYDTTTISVWRDINPQTPGRLLFKNTGTPKYVEFGEKNMPAIGFGATAIDTDYFLPYTDAATATVATFSSNQIFQTANMTIFMVLKPKNYIGSTTTATELLNFCPYDSAATPPALTCTDGKEIKLALDINGKVTFSSIGAGATAGTFATKSVTSTDVQQKKNLIIVSALKDAVGNKLFINGALGATTGANVNLLNNNFIGTFRIGAISGVEIYEIIVFSSNLSDVDRQNVETYLGKKFAIPMAKS